MHHATVMDLDRVGVYSIILLAWPLRLRFVRLFGQNRKP